MREVKNKTASVSIKNLTRQNVTVLAGLPFQKIADEVLPDWEISLVFVAPKKAQELNKQLRDKDYTPNVLSYAVGEKSAEIFICPSEATKQAPDFNLEPSTFNLLLFIHGVLHIKGLAHGAKMEKCERDILHRYVEADSDRHRHRHLPNKGSRR
jgi:rRNA maturation RNase YbeY